MILAACGLGLGYVRLGSECETLGSEIKELERENRLLARAVLTEEYQWSRINSAVNIRRALSRHNLSMDFPRDDQIVRILAEDRGTQKVEGGAPLLARSNYHE